MWGGKSFTVSNVTLDSEGLGASQQIEGNTTVEANSQAEVTAPMVEYDVVSFTPGRRLLGLVSDHVPAEWEHKARRKHWDIPGTLRKAGDKTFVERDDGKIQIGQEPGSPAVFWDETGGRPTLTSDPPDFVTTFLPEFDRHHPGAIAAAVGENYGKEDIVQSGSAQPYAFGLEGRTGRSRRDPFVQKLFYPGEISVFWGGPGVGKTFLATDLACHLAAGSHMWMGLGMDRGGVIYVALEARSLVQSRIDGWKDYHGKNETLPIVLNEEMLSFEASNFAEKLIASIQKTDELFREEFDVPVRLVVIDTFTRAMGGLEENSGRDVTNAFNKLEHVKEQTGCHIMVIHHSGKDASKGPKGSVSIVGCADMDIEIKAGAEPRTGILCPGKQRGNANDVTFGFRLEKVEQGFDKWGDPITTAICQLAQVTKKLPKKAGVTGQNLSTLNKLKEMLGVSGESTATSSDGVRICMWELECVSGGIYNTKAERDRRKRFQACKKILIERGYVREEGGYAFWLSDSPGS